MSPTPKPPKLSVVCPDLCSFHPDKIGQDKADALRALRETGAGRDVFGRHAAAILGQEYNPSTISRHLKHYREAADDPELAERDEKIESGKSVTDLEILNSIIAAGFRNSRSWKPSIKDTLDAMRLKVQLTGNSAFEDMLAAMEAGLDLAEGFDGEEDEETENPEALLSAGERGEG